MTFFTTLTTLGSTLCSLDAPLLYGLLDLTAAPPLLYYAYIPVSILATLLGLLVYRANPSAPSNKAFLAVNLFFVAWVVNTLLQWIIAPNALILLSWHLILPLEIGLYTSVCVFAYVFLLQKNLSHAWVAALALVGLLALVVTPTTFNIAAYNPFDCEGVLGYIWGLLYTLEAAAILFCGTLGIYALRTERDHVRRRLITLTTTGIVVFMSIFWISDVYGELTGVYEFNLWGPLGMGIFLVLIGYLITQNTLFDVKIITTEALVAGIALLIGSQFFRPATQLDLVLAGFTLTLFLVAGLFLIRSVKKEIEGRELLRIANVRQAEITSLITHQIRGVFTNTKAGLSTMLEGLYGDVPPKLAHIIEGMYTSQVAGVTTVETFLQAQKIESGTTQYVYAPVNIRALVEECFASGTATAAARQLGYTLTVEPNDYTLSADKIYLTQVIANLIDNALRYTQTGSITVSLSRSTTHITYSVADTGVGIRPEDHAKIFTKYGHGTDSRKINPSSTGLGLYIVKEIVEAHGGTITYTSVYGAGTTFTVTLPIAPSTQ